MSPEMSLTDEQPTATREDFQASLVDFRNGMMELFESISPRFSPAGIEAFKSSTDELDERLFYMAFGLKEGVTPDDLQQLVSEVGYRKEVLVEHFDNQDILKDSESFARMIPRAANMIKASLIAKKALRSDALTELNRLDAIDRD